jgi:mannose/fructose/N-acetylgalactosamine-specific phosphotransferase system component IIC
MLQGLHSLRDGRLACIERLHLRCLATSFGRGFVSSLVFLALMLGFWLPLYAHLPRFLLTALGILPVLLPGLGVGAMVDRYGWKSSWPWVTGGLAGAYLLARCVG